ncbi:MAG: hypothetical protein ACE5E1_07370 [Phycisphaerae bacterium]
MEQGQKRVLDVGNCDADHAKIRHLLTKHFDVVVERARLVDEAIERMRACRYDLILFNRLIFADGSEGVELLRRARTEDLAEDTPIMLISNYEEAQAACEAAGGQRGFGKAELGDRSTIERLARYLPRR